MLRIKLAAVAFAAVAFLPVPAVGETGEGRVQIGGMQLNVPRRYQWSGTQGAEGETQETKLPDGAVIKAKRTTYVNYFARAEKESMHSLDLWAMAFAVEPKDYDASALFDAAKAAPVTHAGRAVSPETWERISVDGRSCVKFQAWDELQGSKRYPNELFDYRVYQVDCAGRRGEGALYRIYLSERIRRGAPSTADGLLKEILGGVKFSSP